MLSRENAAQLSRFYKKIIEQKPLKTELFNVNLNDYMAKQKGIQFFGLDNLFERGALMGIVYSHKIRIEAYSLETGYSLRRSLFASIVSSLPRHS
jgi:hypothetical protein